MNAIGHVTTIAALSARALWRMLGRPFRFVTSCRITGAHAAHVLARRYPAIVLTAFLGAFPAIATAQAALPLERSPGSDGTSLTSGTTSSDPGSAGLEPVPHEQVVAIPSALLERLQREVIAPTRSRNKRLDLLVALLFEPAGLMLQYDGTRTRTITESIADRKANCLSFSLLFTALARRAGIEADVQESDHVLVGHQGGVLYSNGHVNVSVHISGTRKTVDIDRSVMAVGGEARRVTDGRALSHFYNNRGAELMEAGELDAAQRHFELAVRITPGFVAAWNNLGVVNMRKGLLSESERAYARVLDENPRHAPALSNLVKLYRRRGNSSKQVEFEKRLFRVQSKDPFHQVVLAMGYEHKGDYERALVHYRRALRLQEDEPYIHFGMARAYAHLGETQRAAEELMRARDRASDQRSLYQAKLDRLRRLHQP